MTATMLATTTIATGALAADKLDRTVLPIPEPKVRAITTFDARNVTSTIRSQGTSEGAQRHGHHDRRYGVRHVQRLWRTYSYVDHRPSGRGGSALQPFSYHGPLLVDADGSTERAQPSHK